MTKATPAARGSSANAPPKLAANVAVTDRAALIVMPQSPAVPAHAPLQPENVAPAAATAVSVTIVPGANAATHVAPQLIAAGLLLTLPGPEVATESVKLCCTKVAVTVVSAASVTTHVPVPAQPPPLQPVKAEPGSALAVSVTVAPVV